MLPSFTSPSPSADICVTPIKYMNCYAQYFVSSLARYILLGAASQLASWHVLNKISNTA